MILAAKPISGKAVIKLAVISVWLAGATYALAEAPAPKHPDGVLQSVEGEGTPAVVLDDNRVESLLGKEISGPGGEKLGRIVDVLVSRQGELRAAVVDFGGFLGVGTRKVAVAWSTLSFGDAGPVLKMTADELRVTPEYRAGEPVVVVGAPGEGRKPPLDEPASQTTPPPAPDKPEK